MTSIRKRFIAAASILGFAALVIGVGVGRSAADDPKAPDLSDLRDAIKAATKRGENVDEVQKAFDALDKALAKGWAPKAGRNEPPTELTTLRNAVEEAARKGENVEEIRKQLDAVEKTMLGRTLVSPKPMPPTEPVRPNPPPANFQRPIRPFPVPPIPEPIRPGELLLPGGAGIDQAALQKAQDQMRKALELLVNNPNDPDAKKLMDEAREMMLKAMVGGNGGVGPGALILPGIDRIPELGGARAPDRFRLGVRMERVTPITADQLGIDAGRGIAITDVIAGSPAEKAGFKAHDILLEFAGKPVTDNLDDFARQVDAAKSGEKIDAVVLRKGKKTEIKGIALPDAPQEFPQPGRRGPPDINPLVPQLPGAVPPVDQLLKPGVQGAPPKPLPIKPVVDPIKPLAEID